MIKWQMKKVSEADKQGYISTRIFWNRKDSVETDNVSKFCNSFIEQNSLVEELSNCQYQWLRPGLFKAHGWKISSEFPTVIGTMDNTLVKTTLRYKEGDGLLTISAAPFDENFELFKQLKFFQRMKFFLKEVDDNQKIVKLSDGIFQLAMKYREDGAIVGLDGDIDD